MIHGEVLVNLFDCRNGTLISPLIFFLNCISFLFFVFFFFLDSFGWIGYDLILVNEERMNDIWKRRLEEDMRIGRRILIIYLEKNSKCYNIYIYMSRMINFYF